MGDLVYALIMVTTMGDMDPIITSHPVTPFRSEEQCEKRLMTYLEEGYLMSSSNGTLAVSLQGRFIHSYATCVTMLDPQ